VEACTRRVSRPKPRVEWRCRRSSTPHSSNTHLRHYPTPSTFECGGGPQSQRWSRFVRQLAKVDLPMRRMIHYEDAETVFV